jgi:hypothetical protein
LTKGTDKYRKQVETHKQEPLQLVSKGVIPKEEAVEALEAYDAENSGKEIEINEFNLPDSEADILFLYLLGDKINNQLTALYQGRGVPKLSGFRRSLHEVFENGGFVVSGDKELPQRTGNDDNHQHPVNRRIRALCGHDAYVHIQDAARPAKLTNVAGLRMGLQSALDRWAL